MDRGPSVIHATDLQAAASDKGQGMKIGVVDTGVDPSSPFLNPTGFTAPAGFPRGDAKQTTPQGDRRARLPRPGPRQAQQQGRSTRPSRTARTSPGIAAGDEGTNAPAGPDHPATANLSGVAPKAWIGNYRVFTVPTPLGHQANTPEIVQRVRGGGRRRHERDQLLGRRPADRPGERRDVRERSATSRSPASCR